MTTIPQDNDNDQGASADEIAEAKSIDIRSLGIEPLSTPIPVLIKHYSSHVDSVRNYNDQKAKEKADPKDPVTVVTNRTKANAKNRENAEMAALVDQVRSTAAGLSEQVFTSLQGINGLLTSFVMLQEMENVVSLLKDNYNYYFENAVQNEKNKLGITVTPSEKAVTDKLTAVALLELIKNRIAIAEAMGDDVSSFFKVSDAGRKGFDNDVIPRLPKLDMGDAAPKKSYVSTSLHFSWQANGETVSVDVDPSYTLNDVAHNVVSSPTFRITGAEIAARLKKEGHGIGATDELWKLEFPTGNLFGKKA